MTGPEAERLGRKIALHLRKQEFGACHEILDFAEQEHGDGFHDAMIENIAETNLPLRLINKLEEAKYAKIADFRDVTDKELLAIDLVGKKYLPLIRNAVERAVRHNKEVQRRRDECETSQTR